MQPETFDLDRAKLAQERDLRERELALREREVALKEQEYDLQREQSWWSRWSTPAVAAIVAGLIGYMGTLISSYQNRKLEREKQEGTLILEAIKVPGPVEEREKLTAANLVFLADAGLITTIKAEQIGKLRAKAGSTIPSLPIGSSVEFESSPILTSDLQAKLEKALRDYQAHLTGLGYVASKSGRIGVRVDEEVRNNAYFSIEDDEIVLGPNLAHDPQYTVSEFTWYALKQSNPSALETLADNPTAPLEGFAQGVRFYLTCSYLNDPVLGRNYYSLVDLPKEEGRNHLYDLSEFKTVREGIPAGLRPLKMGEIWAGALWELRARYSKAKVDRLIFETWKRLRPTAGSSDEIRYYVDEIVRTNLALDLRLDDGEIRRAFSRRKLQ